MRLRFCRVLLLGLCCGALPLAVLAQDQPPEQVTLGPFDSQGSVSMGYRFTDIGGRQQKFSELFNLRQGFRVTDFNLFGRTQPGASAFADSFSVTASGLGGDPFPGGQLTLRKDKLYDLRVNYRQSYYYWDRNDSVVVPAAPGVSPSIARDLMTSNHDFATVRRFGSANLTVRATNNLHFLFEYARNSRRGVNFTTRELDYFGSSSSWGSFLRASPFYVEAPIYDHLQRFTGGFSYSPKNWNFHYKLGYQTFRQIMDWQNVDSPELTFESSNSSRANEALSFARWFESREFKTPVSEFSFLGHPHRRLDVRGGYIFYRYKGPDSMQSVFNGDAPEGSGFAPYGVEFNSHADLTEPNHVVDAGTSVKITDWWNLHTDYRYSRFTVDSMANFHSVLDLATEADGELAYQWKSRTHLFDANLEFLPTRGLILRPGIRLMRRDIQVLEDGVIDDVRTKRINTVWPTLGAYYQPTKKFSVRGDFQAVTNGASYTRISPHTDVGGRIIFRFKPTEKLTVEDNLVLRSRKFLETDFKNNIHFNAINIAYDLNDRFGVYGGFSYDSWFATAGVTFLRGTEPRDVVWRDQTVNRVWTGGLVVKPTKRLGFNFSGNFVRTTGAGEISGELPYFGPMTWPMGTGSIYYDFPKIGRFSVDLQRTYYIEEIIHGNDFQANWLSIRWTRDF
jgi:hypothetical protein